MRLQDDVVERPALSTGMTQQRLGMPLWIRLLVAAGSGLALALAFPPFSWPWLVPVAAGTLTLACRGLRVRGGLLVGLVFGLAFFLLLLQWSRVIGPDAWLALSVIEAAFVALLGAGLVLVTRLRGWPVWASALWVGVELARSAVPLGGFPWGRLAFALDSTPFAPLASLGGVAFVTFVAALVGNLVLWAVVGAACPAARQGRCRRGGCGPCSRRASGAPSDRRSGRRDRRRRAGQRSGPRHGVSRPGPHRHP